MREMIFCPSERACGKKKRNQRAFVLRLCLDRRGKEKLGKRTPRPPRPRSAPGEGFGSGRRGTRKGEVLDDFQSTLRKKSRGLSIFFNPSLIEERGNLKEEKEYRMIAMMTSVSGGERRRKEGSSQSRGNVGEKGDLKKGK